MNDCTAASSPRPKKKRAKQTEPTISTSCDSTIAPNYNAGANFGTNAIPLELSNSTLYMALKHVIWYTNSLFAIKSHSDLQQCHRTAGLAQRYINAAISSISPYEPLGPYRLKRPLDNNLNSFEHIPFKNDSYCLSEVSTLDCAIEDSFRPNETDHVDKVESITSLLDVYMYKSQSQPVPPKNQAPAESISTIQDGGETESSDSGSKETNTPISDAVKKFKEQVNHQPQIPQEYIQSEWSRNDFPFSPLVEKIRSNFFKYPSFRGIQLQAINALLSGKDVFVTMATGGGKSLCYQLPPLVFGGVAVVFSPLLSLIKDQIKHMQQIGLHCVENVTTYKTFVNLAKPRGYEHGDANGLIWFMTPEKYASSSRTLAFLQKLYDENQLRLFAIDEAHCISQWGTDFRKDYRKLGSLRAKFPHVPIIALTATSPPNVTKDILTSLRISGAICLNSNTSRRNLWLEVRSKSKTQLKEIVKILGKAKESAIIYCLSTKDCERVAEELVKCGITAGAYHSKMDNDTRLLVQQEWMENRKRVIVATMAFGMGIDKSNVRYILHHSPPSSLDRYYQEIGRAGRDGKFARTVLWYSPHDFDRLKSLVKGKPKFSQAIDQVANYCYNKLQCRHMLISQFLHDEPEGESTENCAFFPGATPGCDNCTKRLKSVWEDVTIEAREIAKFVAQAMAHRTNPFLTVSILVNALRGSMMKVVVKYSLDKLPGHGCLKGASKERIMEIVRKLLAMGVLRESHRRSKNFGRTVVSVGNGAKDLIGGNMRLFIDAVTIDGGVKAERNSSVLEAASRNNIKRSIPEQLFSRSDSSELPDCD
ncbi:ATP-dependent DNA helicase Q-like 4A [Babesia microti strain RI]|uniref:DNA 3'-5' helicase n=1 Tax=Babesia microti (strain RI) TaxID=1133968 RepID=I7IGF2_BABMR|nr:ATP-dependent DNA helicase Q-like 4A [Babesia microti strain RI]CCF73756.1 ATP-dependent DNA helicase Q-like 4A [Babesia microti strain RI]|eukprot:XP_012648365.1 ATP-dependent DNA helicase Q-like 4A [Babesia microti strain RI]